MNNSTESGSVMDWQTSCCRLDQRDPQLGIFIDVIPESFESWLDSENPELILVIPWHGLVHYLIHNVQKILNIQEITMMPDSRIST